jgi:hypothetical protein
MLPCSRTIRRNDPPTVKITAGPVAGAVHIAPANNMLVPAKPTISHRHVQNRFGEVSVCVVVVPAPGATAPSGKPGGPVCPPVGCPLEPGLGTYGPLCGWGVGEPTTVTAGICSAPLPHMALTKSSDRLVHILSSASHAFCCSLLGDSPIGSRRFVGLFPAYTYTLIPPASPIGSSLMKRPTPDHTTPVAHIL